MFDCIIRAFKIIARRTEAIVGLAAVTVSLVTQIAISIAAFA